MNTSKGNIAALVIAIAAGRSLSEAAAASGMSVRTVQRRLQEPEVAMAIEEARVDLTRQALGQLMELRDIAFTRLREVLNDSQDLSAVLRAADQVLRHGAAMQTLRVQEDVLALEYEVSAMRTFVNGGGQR